jgi:hypothetical protein
MMMMNNKLTGVSNAASSERTIGAARCDAGESIGICDTGVVALPPPTGVLPVITVA